MRKQSFSKDNMPCCGSETVIAKIKTVIQWLKMACCRFSFFALFSQNKESIFSIFVWRLWNGVIAAASPRIATQNTLYGKKRPFEDTVFLQGFYCILRTSGCEATCRRGMHRDSSLIKAY